MCVDGRGGILRKGRQGGKCIRNCVRKNWSGGTTSETWKGSVNVAYDSVCQEMEVVDVVIGITWLVTLWVSGGGGGGEAKSPMGFSNSDACILLPVKRGFSFPPLPRLYAIQIIVLKIFYFYLPILNSATKQSLFLGRKKLIGGEGFGPQPLHLPSCCRIVKMHMSV